MGHFETMLNRFSFFQFVKIHLPENDHHFDQFRPISPNFWLIVLKNPSFWHRTQSIAFSPIRKNTNSRKWPWLGPISPKNWCSKIGKMVNFDTVLNRSHFFQLVKIQPSCKRRWFRPISPTFPLRWKWFKVKREVIVVICCWWRWWWNATRFHPVRVT